MGLFKNLVQAVAPDENTYQGAFSRDLRNIFSMSEENMADAIRHIDFSMVMPNGERYITKDVPNKLFQTLHYSGFLKIMLDQELCLERNNVLAFKPRATELIINFLQMTFDTPEYAAELVNSAQLEVINVNQ